MTRKEEKEIGEREEFTLDANLVRTRRLDDIEFMKTWNTDLEKLHNKILKEQLIAIKTPFCHIIKPDGVMGKEFMVENALLRHCVGCNDEEQCWSIGQLNDLIKEESKTLLNQDF